MSTAEKWAMALLVIYGIGSLWDLIDPRAMSIDWNSGGRLIVSLCGAVCALTLPLVVLGAAPLVFALVFVSVIALAAIAALVKG